MRRGGRFEPSLGGGGGGGGICVPMFVQVSLVRENTMTFLKFGIISNHLANSFSSDLIPHLHGSGWGWGWGGGLILLTPLMFTVRWSIEVSTHLTLMIPLIFPIQRFKALSSTMSIFVVNSLGVLK